MRASRPLFDTISPMRLPSPNTARILGSVGAWTFIVISLLGTVTAFGQDKPLLLFFSGLMVVIFPGLTTVLSLRRVDALERGWYYLTLISLACLTTPVIWLGLSGLIWSIVSLPLYLFTLLPFVVISRAYTPEKRGNRSVWYPLIAAGVCLLLAMLFS